LFAGASVIVAPHGAALANIVFCKPGTRVVEISTRAGYRDWYWQLAAVAGLSYEVMEAQRSGSFSGPYENADMIVSRENLERLLERPVSVASARASICIAFSSFPPEEVRHVP
jgi:capsular polysaccharide biosynthesis protein